MARTDLAEAALAVLGDPAAHTGRCYELSGTTAFSIPDLAQRIAVPYEPTSFEEERARLADLSLFAFQPPMLMSISSAAAAGFLESDATDLMELVPEPQDALEIACAVARRSAQ